MGQATHLSFVRVSGARIDVRLTALILCVVAMGLVSGVTDAASGRSVPAGQEPERITGALRPELLAMIGVPGATPQSDPWRHDRGHIVS